VVDAQIATTFDFAGSLFGAGAYKGTATVSLHVTDITGGSSVPIASHALFEQERSGDQGLTDISAAGETQTLRGSANSSGEPTSQTAILSRTRAGGAAARSGGSRCLTTVINVKALRPEKSIAPIATT
jgi:hypothetical protein